MNCVSLRYSGELEACSSPPYFQVQSVWNSMNRLGQIKKDSGRVSLAGCSPVSRAGLWVRLHFFVRLASLLVDDAVLFEKHGETDHI